MLGLKIRRDHILEDTIAPLENDGEIVFADDLKIEFVGEPGVDQGT